MAAPSYLTPLQLAVLAWPATVRPEELGPSRRSLVVPAVVGTGTIALFGATFDQHRFVVQIVQPGGSGVATYRYQSDGAAWSDETLTDTNPQPLMDTTGDPLVGGADTGLRLAFPSATGYLANDEWSWTTKPVQAIVAAILAASADAKSLLSGPNPDGGGRYLGDLETITGQTLLDCGVLQDVAVLARLILAERRGLDPQSADGRLYIEAASRARKKLIEIPNDQRHPLLAGSQPHRHRPVIYHGEDRYQITRAARGPLPDREDAYVDDGRRLLW